MLVSVDLNVSHAFVSRRKLRVQSFEGVENREGHGQITVPFLVGRNDVPRRPRSRAAIEHLFVSGHVNVLHSAIVQVFGRKLPLFIGFIEAGLKSFFLFFFRDVQKKLMIVVPFSESRRSNSLIYS